MKFNVAWSQVLTQNVALRFAILSLSLCVLGLLVVVAKVAIKAPIIIERGCHSVALDKGKPERTEQEITSFLKEALSQRFDSDNVPQVTYLSPEEGQFREQEQRDLKSKEMRQRVIINEVKKIDGNNVTVDSDRLISIGAVRSAFSFPLNVLLVSEARSPLNPYGLKIVQTKALEMEKKSDK